MNKKIPWRVGVDVDGVVANYTQTYLAAVQAATKREIPKGWAPAAWDLDECLGLTGKERRDIYALMDMPGVAGRLALYPGSKEGIKKLCEIADVFFVTSPLKTSPTWCFDRTAWVRENFGDKLADNIHHTAHKYTFGADVFIDDKPSHCTEWQTSWPAGIALLWSPNYAKGFKQDEHLHVYDWDQVIYHVGSSGPSQYVPVDRVD